MPWNETSKNQTLLRGLEQFATLAPALVAEPGIEADHQPLSGEVRAGDLGDRDRASLAIAQEPLRDLLLVAPAVPMLRPSTWLELRS